jgi:hypothetical protein
MLGGEEEWMAAERGPGHVDTRVVKIYLHILCKHIHDPKKS